MKKLLLLVPLLFAGCGGGDDSGDSGVRGVTDTTVTFGTHTDLSGPLATWGVPGVNALRMRFDEANEAGGVHGRTIHIVAEDSQYQVPLAVKAVNKLVNVDDIFAMVGAMGTPHNNATFGTLFDAGVPSLFPATAAVSMAEPLHPMKFSFFVSYRDQALGAIKYFVADTGASKVCLQRIATDYGEEVENGFNQAVDELGLEVVYKGGHKITETDFVGTVTSIKNSGCELLVLGPFIKDTIMLYSSLRDAGWDKPIVSNMVSYVQEVSGAGDTEGLYAATSMFIPGSEELANEWARDWMNRYRVRFGREPVVQAAVTYMVADVVIRGLENAGRELTLDSFLAGLEAIDHHEDPFGGPLLSLSPTKHVAADTLNLYQVQDGKWVKVADGITF